MRKLETYETETFHSDCLLDEDTMKYINIKRQSGWTVESTKPCSNGGYEITMKRKCEKHNTNDSDKK